MEVGSRYLAPDYPVLAPDRWIKDFADAGFKPEVHDLILKQNAIKALKLGAGD